MPARSGRGRRRLQTEVIEALIDGAGTGRVDAVRLTAQFAEALSNALQSV